MYLYKRIWLIVMMRNKYVIVLISLFTVLFVRRCQGQEFDSMLSNLYRYTVPQVKADSLNSWLHNDGQPLVLLDTRTPKEFAVSHLPTAQLVDYDRFKAKDVQHIPKDAKVVVYCSVGYRSERIGEKLQKLGFTEVYNLYGGIFDWKNTGHQVMNPAQAPTDSVHTYNKAWSKWLQNGVRVYK